ncbi:MAG TPA: zf-HC2 domain-containing protein, partial [Ktedonobacterales bacterium]
MTTANASCPLGISPATIAAWRDGALASDESARIAAHVSGCEACRHEIALYESLDDALRRQSVPASDGRLWRAVRSGMAATQGPRNTRRTARRMAGALGALAAVLLLALGFAQLFQARGGVSYHPGSTATTVQGTPTPLPTAAPASPAVRVASPNWQTGNFPASGITFGDRSDDILSFGVASTDGNIAYACYSQTSNTGGHVNSQITIYRTSDRAIHWTRLAQFPWPDAQTSDCTVQVDALDSSRVLVNILGGVVGQTDTAIWYELTEDGGATWTKLSYNDGLSYLATANGCTYAIRWQVVGQQSNGLPKYDIHLSVSTDHLRTWQPIDGALTDPVQNQGVTRFWLNPDGELLAEATTSTTNANGIPTTTGRSLWLSDDGGAHWSAFPLPNLGGGGVSNSFIGSWTVQQPTTHGQAWRLCADEMASDGRTTMGIVCTSDGGHTWTTRPYLCVSAPCLAGTSPGFAGSGDTLTADGSLLFIAP